MISLTEATLREKMPDLRGKLRERADLSKVNWFQVGGEAEMLFRPEDTEDLAYFMQHKPADMAVTVLGVGSNLIIRDGGISGIVIRLGKGFVETTAEGVMITAGAGGLGLNVAQFAQAHSLAGLEFLSGIPGSVGGALAMNAGAYGRDVSMVLQEAEAVDDKGNIRTLSNADMGYVYRGSAVPAGWIFTRAIFKAEAGESAAIAARMNEIQEARAASQPIRSRTGGSTFKNPAGMKAWELIEKAGCRGLTIGGAQVSEKHCNFLINTGEATAEDLERLGEEVRRRVLEHSGIMLEWEIKRIGKRKERDMSGVVASGGHAA